MHILFARPQGAFQSQCYNTKTHLALTSFHWFWVRKARASDWWDEVQAALAIVLDLDTSTLKNAAKLYRGLGLCMPTI